MLFLPFKEEPPSETKKVVCIYVTTPRNPNVRFKPLQLEAHLANLKKIYPNSPLGQPHTYVMRADGRTKGWEGFRYVIQNILGTNGLLSIEFQTGLSYVQKDSGKFLIGVDLMNHPFMTIFKDSKAWSKAL